MSTLRDANKAREKHADYLQKDLGAHSILVDKVRDKGKDTFAVIAFYDSLPNDAPRTLEIESEGRVKKVPLRSELVPTAELE